MANANDRPVFALEVVVAALYLRGLSRPIELHARTWPDVVSCLRRAGFGGTPAGSGRHDEASRILSGCGFRDASVALDSPAAQRAECLLRKGLALTAVSPLFPSRWVAQLGEGAPPALYCRGPMALLAEPLFGIVGSRRPPPASRKSATAVAAAATKAGYTILSGGAPGIDRIAERAGDRVVEIWPCGLARRWGLSAHPSALRLSLWPPQEEFSTAGAMERNALIFALGSATFVAHARFKEGGAWHGAVGALRRRLGPVLVASGETPGWGQAGRALIALGARAFDVDAAFTEALEAALRQEPIQSPLFEAARRPAAARALAVF